MKTNTYLQFKNWFKTTCIEKVSFGNTYAVYTCDTAHAIYTAWYMFKHNFSEQQVDEYIQKDIENSRKHFYNHGFRVTLRNTRIEKIIPEDKCIFINLRPAPFNDCFDYEGGGEWFDRGITQRTWTRIVKAIWEHWTCKLIEEMEVENEKSR